jgi:hypothetical protein
LAAIADAPFRAWYVSTRYMPEAMKIHRLPHAKGMAATTGDAQEISDRAVQANQNSPIAGCCQHDFESDNSERKLE